MTEREEMARMDRKNAIQKKIQKLGQIAARWASAYAQARAYLEILRDEQYDDGQARRIQGWLDGLQRSVRRITK